MKTKPIQLAHLYRNGLFLGYGIAVDGVLLDQLKSTTIDTVPGELPCIKADFNISNDLAENPVKIDISEARHGKV